LKLKAQYDIIISEKRRGGTEMKQLTLFAEENRLQKLSEL
jgi:hypothetical protein